MRPFRLELEGFGPFRQKQVVDFSDVELFAITGPTGSGKSTLLEAIAFALFKRTPRGQSLEELRHPSASKVRVVLDFQVGDGVYRVVRHLEPQGGRLLSQDQLFRQEETRWERVDTGGIKELNQRLEGLLGLTYEAFTKALLLPQGEFDRLLKGEARERRALLQKLFGLEHLERAREQARLHGEEVRGRLMALEGELKGLEEARPERKGALEEELRRLKGEAKRLEGRLEKKREELEEARRREEYWGRRRSLEAVLFRLNQEAEELQRVRKRLEKAEEARRLLPLYQELRAREEALLEAERELEALQKRLKELDQERAPLLRQEERLKEVEEELSRLQALRGQEALLRGWKVGLDFSRPDPLPATEGELIALQEEIRKAEAFSKAKEAFEARKRALEEAEAELKALEEEGKGLKAHLEALKRAEMGQKKAVLLSEKARLEEARARVQKGISALEEERRRLLEEKERMGLYRYHALLEPGRPCPLCGQEVQDLPPPPSLEDFSPRLAKTESELRGLLSESARLEERLKGLEKELQPLEGVEAEPALSERGLEELQERVRALEERLVDLREAYREKRGRLEVLREETRRLQEEVSRLEPPRRPLGKVWEEWERRLAGLVRALWEATGGEWPSEKETRLIREREGLGQVRGRLEALAQEEARLKERFLLLRDQKARLLLEREQAQRKLQGLPPEEELLDAYLEEGEEAALRNRLERHEEERKESEAALRALGNPPGPPVALGERQALEQEVRELEEGLKALERRIGSLEGGLLSLEAALKRRLELEKEMAELIGELSLWQELLKDLEGRNFPAYLLAHYQKEFLARASELLHTLSQGRYRFGADGDRFLVVDAWTEVERPVHTLSGGETFQASLALALALSEGLSRGRLMALFLDEGFGSLDPESLEEAASVLETLPTKGRLVGVVTHVEALAERLPARLRVRKHPSGSRVEWV